MMPLRIRERLIILLMAPLTILAIFFATTVWLQAQTRANTNERYQITRSLVAYGRLLATLADAETGARGYVITAIPRFKEPYWSAAANLDPELAHLAELAGDDPVEQAALPALQHDARAAFDRDRDIVALVDRGSRGEAERLVAGGAGKAAMDRLRRTIAADENVALARRDRGTAELEALWQRTNALVVVVALVAIGLTLTLYLTMSRDIVDRLRRVGEDAVDISHGIVPATKPSGGDEIAELGRALHKIIAVAHRREQVLRKYQLLADQAQHMIFWLDENDTIVEVNQAASDSYGYSRDELMAMRAGDLRSPEIREGFSARLESARELGNVTYETEHVRKNGQAFPVEISLSATTLDDAPMVVGIARDITDRKRAESATAAYHAAVEASLRLKSEFVATMSHEIRTPMNAVIGMTELLLDSDLTTEQRQHSEIIHDASFALLGIIDNVLDFSKIEAGQVELERHEVDVVELVESAASVLADNAHRKGVSLMTYVDDRVPRTVLSDKMRIRQVLINLIGNAVKFTDAGSVVVSVAFEETVGNASIVRFSVKDTGIGFDEATARKIFEPFRQADGSTTRKYGGTGLGLSISRQLVELLGGELEVGSRPGVGSEFGFTLALEHGPLAAAGRPSPLAGRRALIVDNDETALRIFGSYLRRWNVACTLARDADAALEAMRREVAGGTPFDFALVDYAMPERNGLELGMTIKGDAALARTVLVMVTAFDVGKRGQAAIGAGFARYLTKPVRQVQLHDCIVEALTQPMPAAAAERRATKRKAPAEFKPSRLERILLVEDDPVNQLLARRQLEKLGFAAHGVSDGEQAVNAIEHVPYDLVLMDCQMPVMDGFAATRAIRFHEAGTGRHVPIVAMTANAHRDDRDACIAAGMDDYLAKPVQISQLRAMLAAWLPKAEQHAAV